MNAIILFVAASTLGVEYGWEKTGDGQLQYVVQVEPQLLSALEQGKPIESELPAEVQGVRRFVFRVGTAPVRRDHVPVVHQAGYEGGFSNRFAQNTQSTATNQPTSTLHDELPERPRIDLIPFWDRDTFASHHVPAPAWAPRSTNTQGSSNWNTGIDRNRPSTNWNNNSASGSPLANSSLNPNSRSNNRSPISFRDRQTDPYSQQHTPLENGYLDNRNGYDANNRFATNNTHGGSMQPEFEDDDAYYARLARERREGRSTSTGFNNGIDPKRTASSQVSNTQKPTTAGAPRVAINKDGTSDSRQGFSLTFASLLLFASLGGNLYLGWLARDFYWRYRDLAWEMRGGHSSGAAP